MKTVSLFITLLIVMTTSLIARENPFEPTQTYETEVARLMEIEEDYPYEFQEKEDQVEHEVKKAKTPVKKAMTPKQVKKMVAKKKPAKPVKRVSLDSAKNSPVLNQMNGVKKEEKVKTITLENAMEKLDKDEIVVQVPKRKNIEVMEMDADDIQENIDILPFVNLNYTNDKMLISSKYDVFRKFTIEDKNKIVLDYHAKTFFLTKNKITKTAYFEKVIAGNHLKERYFRIVIVLAHKPSKYKVTYTNNLVTIEFDKDMI